MNELKYEIEGAFEGFLDEHKEYTKEYDNNPPSPHKPKYPSIDTTAYEEFNVYRSIYDLSEKELRFLYALMTDKLLVALTYSTENTHPIDTAMSILSVGLQGTAADMELASRTAREYMLKEALEKVAGDYDFCVIDTAPTLGLLTLNALTAADRVIIPMNLEVYSLLGMEQLSGFIDNVRKYTNKDLRISGLLITKYNERQNIPKALKENVEKAAKVMDTRVFNAKIRESVAVKEAQLLRSDLYTEAPKATATLDYMAFVDEFLSMEG